MAEDISNKTLAVLVGLAIIISLAGIMFAPKGAITGKATDTGTAQLHNLGEIAVTATDSSIDFGTGSVNESGTCTLDSAAGTASAACSGTGWLPSGKDVFEIQNTGTYDVNITIKAIKSAATWLNGTTPTQQYERLDGVCYGTNNQSTYASMLTTETKLCSNLTPDKLTNVSLNISLKSDANTGTLTNTITFTGRQSTG